MTPPPFLESPSGLSGRWATPGVTGPTGRVPPVSPEVAALLAARDQLDRLLLVRVGDVETRQLASLDGVVTTSAWLRQQSAELPRGLRAAAHRPVGRRRDRP